jgi:hypothetical protein
MYLAVLLALAAVVTLCLTLSAQFRAVRPCPAAAGTATSSNAPTRGASCDAYAYTGK